MDGGMSPGDDTVPKDENLRQIYGEKRSFGVGHNPDHRIGDPRRPSYTRAELDRVCADFLVRAHDYYPILLHDLLAEPQAPVRAGNAVQCVQA